MRRLAPAAVTLAVLVGIVAVVFHPHRLADWLFLVGICVVLVLALLASSGASWGGTLGWGGGGLHFGPRPKRRSQDRPDQYDYPDSGL